VTWVHCNYALLKDHKKGKAKNKRYCGDQVMENTLTKIFYFTPFILNDQILQFHILINNVNLWDPKE
jgi:hypothetical protein